MIIKTIGDNIVACIQGNQRRVATLFIEENVSYLITNPHTHFEHRLVYTEQVINKRRAAEGKPPLTSAEIDEQVEIWCKCAVDLIIANGNIYIRPETDNMKLALQGDKILQTTLKDIISKQNIRFMYAELDVIKKALRTDGEYWRISPYPRMEDEIRKEIISSKIALNEDPIYYYSSPTGTRFVTCQEFENLSQKNDDYLRRHMIEIRDYSAKTNKRGHREVSFFEAGRRFTHKNFKNLAFENANPEELRRMFATLLAELKAAVAPQFHNDNLNENAWRNHMIAALVDENNMAMGLVDDLPPEFFRMVRWLPGGRFHERELIFDSVFCQKTGKKSAEELNNLLDNRVKGFIGNYILEFGVIEYINIGRIMPAIRKKGKRQNGHRVYLAEIKLPGADKPILRIIRILQWGTRERLDEGKDLSTAYQGSMEYVDFIKQRRHACGELGMPLPGRIDFKHITEVYDGNQKRYHGEHIWTYYFERNFIHGLATDKISDDSLRQPAFCINLARLLGQAAAPNMVVGRMDRTLKNVIFDGGDEMLLFGPDGQPNRLVIADHAGTFYDYTNPLHTFAKDYAKPIVSRLTKVANSDEFKEVYLNSLKERLVGLKEECRKQEDSFRIRFQHCKQGPGSFGDRWNNALTRLKNTDINALINKISDEI